MNIKKFFSTILATLLFITTPYLTSSSFSKTYIMKTSGFGLRFIGKICVPCRYLPKDTRLFDTPTPHERVINTYGIETKFTKVATQYGATIFVRSCDLKETDSKITQNYSITLEEAGVGLNTCSGVIHEKGGTVAERDISQTDEKIGTILGLIAPREQTSCYVYLRTYGGQNSSHKFYLLTIKDLSSGITNSYVLEKIVEEISCGGSPPRLSVKSISITPSKNNVDCPLLNSSQHSVILSATNRHHPKLFDYAPEPSLFSVNNFKQHAELTNYLRNMLYDLNPLMDAILVNFSCSCNGEHREGTSRKKACFTHSYSLPDEQEGLFRYIFHNSQ